MENINRMLKAINMDAVFAQLDIVTTGTCYDEGVELYRVNSRGDKIGEYNYDLDFEDLCTIAKDLMEERKSYNLTEEECGEYQGFRVKVIYCGDIRCHFEVTADGQVSAEYDDEEGDWK